MPGQSTFLAKTFIILLLIIIVYGQAHSTQNTETTASNQAKSVTLFFDEAYPPYSYKKDDVLMGVLPELISLIDESMKEFDIIKVSGEWHHGKQQLREGNVFGLVGTYFIPNRHDFMFPFSYPLFLEEVVLVCHHLTEIETDSNWPEDYRGLKIGTVAGYDGWANSKNHHRSIQGINYFEFPDVELAFLSVKDRITDCTILERLVFQQMLERTENSLAANANKIIRITTSKRNESVHIGFAKTLFLHDDTSDNALEFAKQFDTAVIELHRNGAIAEVLSKHKAKPILPLLQ
ncbi:MAG: transporter substrate-binding domain-containing protein [Pseudomonadota bacterium]